MAIPAVSVALSKFNDEIFRSPPCEVDERVEDLVIELTWMQCFLVDGEQTPEGRARTAVWSPAIERLAVYAQDLHSGFVSPAVKILGIEKLTKKLATLREKLLPFVTTHVGGPSYVAEVPGQYYETDQIKIYVHLQTCKCVSHKTIKYFR